MGAAAPIDKTAPRRWGRCFSPAISPGAEERSMTAVALFGAGGKMGMRIGRNLAASRFETRHVEVSPAWQERVRQAHGVDCQPADQAIAGPRS